MRLHLMLALVLASGCKKQVTEIIAVDAGPAVPEVVRPAIEVADASTSPMREVNPKDAEAVALYLKDCRVMMQEKYEGPEGEKTADECEARDFDQFCAADVYACIDKREKCLGRCDTGCSTCQNACGKICVDCKTECVKQGADAGKDCVVQCAAQRNECRHTCLAAREACDKAPAGCSKAFDSCWEDGNKKRDKACPDCESINSCLFDQMQGGGGRPEACLKKYPGNAKECLEWCNEP